MLHTLPVAQQQHIADLLMGELVIEGKDELSKTVVSLADHFEQLTKSPLTTCNFNLLQPSVILLFGKELQLIDESESVLNGIYDASPLKSEVPMSFETALMLGGAPVYKKEVSDEKCTDAMCGCAVNDQSSVIDEQAFKIQSSIADIIAKLEELNHHFLQFAPYGVFVHAFPGSTGEGATVYVTPVSKPLYFIAPTCTGVFEPGEATSFNSIEALSKFNFFYNEEKFNAYIRNLIKNAYGPK
jgi:hypothetical protein